MMMFCFVFKAAQIVKFFSLLYFQVKMIQVSDNAYITLYNICYYKE